MTRYTALAFTSLLLGSSLSCASASVRPAPTEGGDGIPELDFAMIRSAWSAICLCMVQENPLGDGCLAYEVMGTTYGPYLFAVSATVKSSDSGMQFVVGTLHVEAAPSEWSRAWTEVRATRSTAAAIYHVQLAIDGIDMGRGYDVDVDLSQCPSPVVQIRAPAEGSDSNSTGVP